MNIYWWTKKSAMRSFTKWGIVGKLASRVQIAMAAASIAISDPPKG